MPDPNEFESEKDFMAACVPERIDKGDEQDQAVAVCMSMWEKKMIDIEAEMEAKVGARNSRADSERLQMIHDYAVENGAQCHEQPGVELPPEKSLVSFGAEVKALGDGKVGGYLVRFSTEADPDASQMRDFFTPETDFMLALPAKSPAWFNHALDTKKQRLTNDASLRLDDFGVWAETILDERDRYEKFLYTLAEAGKLGWSSGTASHLVKREPVGEAHKITRWPLGLDASLTHMPAEPRNEVIPLKSLGDYLPPLPPMPDEADAERVESQGDGGEQPITDTLEVKTMDPEELKTLLAEAAEAGAKKALADLPAETKDVGNVTVTKDEADQPFASPGEYFKAVKNAAFYPRDEDPRLRSLKATGLSEGVPADGGYLLNPQMQSGILERMYDVNTILGMCANDTVTGNSMLYNGVDETSHASSLYGGLIGYWLGEASSITASKPSFYQVELKLKKIAALCYATDEQLEDIAFLGSWLTRTVPNVLRWFVEEAIVNGDGVGKPLGIMNSPCLITSNRDTASHIYLADIANLWKRRWRGGQNYVWLIEGGASAELHQLTAATAPIYMPAGNVAGSPFATLYGRPVIETEHCQALNTTGDIILADLGQYQLITKGGVQAASSIHVAFTTGEQCFRFTYRIDGAPLWQSALTPAHGSNTVSPFVCLVSAST